MAVTLDDKLVVGISSRALFDLEEENRIYETEGLEAYSEYQIEHENDILKPGTAFPLIRALHNLNTGDRCLTEIIVMSKNSANTSLRIFKSIEHYRLNISRAALVGGAPIAPYLDAFHTDLFLSANEADVQEAVNAGVAAGLICSPSDLPIDPEQDIGQIRIAFDGDAVIFSDESERIYRERGLDAFTEHEHANAHAARRAVCKAAEDDLSHSEGLPARHLADPHRACDRTECARTRTGHPDAPRMGRPH